MNEASMTINGQRLEAAHVMTIRVALAGMASDLRADGLGDDEHGRFMTTAYLVRIAEMERMMRCE